MGVTGTLELRRVARLCKQAGPQFRKDLYRGIRLPVRPFEAAVKAETPSSMPRRYAGVLAPALRANISTALRGSGLGYTIVVTAKGKREKRDVRAVNNGLLRHPTFGDREAWVSQHVRGGFVDRPTDKLGADVAKQIDAAVSKLATAIEKG